MENIDGAMYHDADVAQPPGTAMQIEGSRASQMVGSDEATSSSPYTHLAHGTYPQPHVNWVLRPVTWQTAQPRSRSLEPNGSHLGLNYIPHIRTPEELELDDIRRSRDGQTLMERMRERVPNPTRECL